MTDFTPSKALLRERDYMAAMARQCKGTVEGDLWQRLADEISAFEGGDVAQEGLFE